MRFRAVAMVLIATCCVGMFHESVCANDMLASDVRQVVGRPSTVGPGGGTLVRRSTQSSDAVLARTSKLRGFNSAATEADRLHDVVKSRALIARAWGDRLISALENENLEMSESRLARAQELANDLYGGLGWSDEERRITLDQLESLQRELRRLLAPNWMEKAPALSEIPEILAPLGEGEVAKVEAWIKGTALEEAVRVANVLISARSWTHAAKWVAPLEAKEESALIAELSIELARSSEAKSRNLFVESLDKFKSLGFSLREDSEPAGFDRPATFNYTRTYRGKDGPGEKLATKAALIWTGKGHMLHSRRGRRISVAPQLALETDIDTSRGKTEDELSLYGGVELIANLTPARFETWHEYVGRSTVILPVQLQAHYLTSTNGKYEEFNAHVDFAPKIGALAMGVRRGHEYGCCEVEKAGKKVRYWRMPKNFVSFYWQPRVAGYYGRVIDGDPAYGRKNDNILRGIFDISARVYLDGFARGLFYGSYNAKVGPLGTVWDQALIPYLEVGYKLFWEDNVDGGPKNELTHIVLNVPLNKAISFDFKFTKGRAAPDYVFVEELAIAIGIKL